MKRSLNRDQIPSSKFQVLRRNSFDHQGAEWGSAYIRLSFGTDGLELRFISGRKGTATEQIWKKQKNQTARIKKEQAEIYIFPPAPESGFKAYIQQKPL